MSDILDKLKSISPCYVELSETVLFGQMWQRNVLSARERSLITVAALTVLNRLEQLPFHLELARKNGLSVEQLSELITHLAFYGGWPVAASALERLALIADKELR